MRRFTLQTESGYDAHKHTCELCNGQICCGELECTDSAVVCEWCFTRPHSCPVCNAAMVEFKWAGDDGYGTPECVIRSQAECPNCREMVCYVEHAADGRGMLRMVYPEAKTVNKVFTGTIGTSLRKTMDAILDVQTIHIGSGNKGDE